MLFLANIQPDLQREVAEQCTAARFTALDTMNMWIDIARSSLRADDRPGRLPDRQRRRAQAAHRRAEPRRAPRARCWNGARSVVVAKQGEYGAAMFTRDGVFALPAYPTADVVDPTGAGDTFAGGFVGYIAAHAGEEIADELLRRAMAYGTVLASFNVEAFGTERMPSLTGEEIAERVAELQQVTHFDADPLPLRA